MKTLSLLSYGLVPLSFVGSGLSSKQDLSLRWLGFKKFINAPVLKRNFEASNEAWLKVLKNKKILSGKFIYIEGDYLNNFNRIHNFLLEDLSYIFENFSEHIFKLFPNFQTELSNAKKIHNSNFGDFRDVSHDINLFLEKITKLFFSWETSWHQVKNIVNKLQNLTFEEFSR